MASMTMPQRRCGLGTPHITTINSWSGPTSARPHRRSQRKDDPHAKAESPNTPTRQAPPEAEGQDGQGEAGTAQDL
jgi:hypothetical protein